MFHQELKTPVSTPLIEQKGQASTSESADSPELKEIGRLLADILYFIFIHVNNKTWDRWLEGLKGDELLIANWLLHKYPQGSNKLLATDENELAKEFMEIFGIMRPALMTALSSHLTKDTSGIIWTFYSLEKQPLAAINSLYTRLSVPNFSLPKMSSQLSYNRETRRIVSIFCRDGDATPLILLLHRSREYLTQAIKTTITDYKLTLKPEVLSLLVLSTDVFPEELKFLLAHSTDPNPEYKYNETALLNCRLQKCSYPENLNNGLRSRSAIEAVAFVRDTFTLKILLQDPRNQQVLDKLNINGQTLLHDASNMVAKEIVEVLLEQKANPLIKNAEGKTALEMMTHYRKECEGLNSTTTLQIWDDLISILEKGEKNWKSTASVTALTSTSSPGFLSRPAAAVTEKTAALTQRKRWFS